MSDSMNEPRLLIPQLKPFYDRIEGLYWLVIRLAAGLIIITHGWPKLMAELRPRHRPPWSAAASNPPGPWRSD